MGKPVYKKVLNMVLEEIRPDYSVSGRVESFVKELSSLIKKSNLKAKVIVGGSFAKGTYLKDKYDCDIFIQFQRSLEKEDISEMLFKSLKSGFKDIEVIHGSRDYYRIKKEIIYEIVPILEAKDPKSAVNVTDMSPSHVKWAKSHFSKKPTLRDEILLAKAFCKAQRVYGAESYIGGFSGHVLDILIINYGSFISLLKNAVKWGEKEVIDVERFYKTKQLAMMGLNQSKTLSPLIVVDPILPQRNAAAALTNERCGFFIRTAKKFLDSPNMDYFYRQEITEDKIMKELNIDNLKLVTILAKPLKGKEDIIGTKLLKAYEYLISALKKNDFKLIFSTWEWDDKDDSMMYFALENSKLPKMKELIGPLCFQKAHAESFKKKHKKVVERNKRLYALEQRKFLTPEDLLRSIFEVNSIDKEYLKEKVKELKVEKVTLSTESFKNHD